MQNQSKIAIISLGLVGSLMAIYLRKHKREIHVSDRNAIIKTINFAIKSINLAMSNRFWKALSDAAAENKVRNTAIPINKRALHLVNNLVAQPYGKNSYSISKGVPSFQKTRSCCTLYLFYPDKNRDKKGCRCHHSHNLALASTIIF